jgi:hypothetical protein
LGQQLIWCKRLSVRNGCDDHLMGQSMERLDGIETWVEETGTNDQKLTDVWEGLDFNANNDMAFDFLDIKRIIKLWLNFMVSIHLLIVLVIISSKLITYVTIS